MDIREIQNLIKFVAKSGATEVKLEMDDFKITIKTTEAGSCRNYNLCSACSNGTADATGNGSSCCTSSATSSSCSCTSCSR